MMKHKFNNKIALIIVGIILYTVGAAYAAYAAGLVFFGGASNQVIQTFTAVGTQTWTVPKGVASVEALVVAGGGGGGSSVASSGGGGGGGAGGLKYVSSYSVSEGQVITVTVGAGGAPGTTNANQMGSDGSPSSFDTITATGGGGGANTGSAGRPGGSGGGAGYNGYSATRYGGSGVAGQGNAGGNTPLLSWAGGAGGGGAGGVGGDNKTGHAGGDRGPGLSYSITGTPVIYSIGGGGGSNSPASSPANTGKGGDAAYSTATAYAGGSGIVVIKYNISPMIQPSSIQKGLVGHWTLDADNYNANTGRVTDKTPYENHGTNYGATLATDRNGQSNGAMSFDGVNDYVNALNSSVYDLQSGGTVSIWVKIPSPWTGNAYPNIVSKGASAGWDSNGWSLYGFSDNRIGIGMRNGASAISASFTNTIKNQWTHIVGVWNGTIITLYQDGVYKTSGGQTIAPGLNTTNVIIGRGPTDNYFGGSIGEVKIYNRALSADEVSTLYNSNKPKIVSDSLQKGLVLDMPLTSTWTKTITAGSQIMTDKTPYSNDGQNYGATVGTSSTSFNGSSNYINLGNSDNLKLSQGGSIGAWVKIGALASGYGNFAVMKGDGASWANLHYGLFELSGTDSFVLVLSNGTNSLSDGGPRTASLLADTWYYISGTWDSTTKCIYLNGVLQQCVSSSIMPKDSMASSFVNIGRAYGGAYYFNGSISDVKIYNRALSPQEIENIYVRSAVNFGGVKSFRSSCKEILNAGESTGDGFYTIKPNSGGLSFKAYCDMTTDGGGWTLVLLNNMSLTSPTPIWNDAIYNVNTTGSLDTNLTSFDLFLGLSYWQSLGTKMRLQIGSTPTSLTNKAIYSAFSFSGGDYALNMSGENVLVGSGSPGMYTYHAVYRYNLTTSDRDNDVYTYNCSTSYGNAPWWYGACWSGSFWGHTVSDGARWTGSSGGTQQWGSIWVGQ